MVDFTGIERVRELVNRAGTAAFIETLAGEIEADYRRWHEFDKSPRHAAHSPVGVIELMPISDGKLYSFKYVNGHPKNTAQGLLTVTAFGVLVAGFMALIALWHRYNQKHHPHELERLLEIARRDDLHG